MDDFIWIPAHGAIGPQDSPSMWLGGEPDWTAANDNRRGNWLQTYTGRQFWPMDPRASEVCIEDIAHSLAMQCRYAGHCKRFYCPTPDQRVLTADLRWVPAGELSVGDELLGFDEHPIEIGSLGKRRRRHRHSFVTHAVPVKRNTIRLVMSDGTSVTASEEHPWLVATKASRNQKWLTASEIANDILAGRKRYMHKFYNPWTTSQSRQAGWLAGIFDGEGYFSSGNRRGVLMGVAQNHGLVLDGIKEAMSDMGFPTAAPRKTGSVDSSVITLQMTGGWKEITRLLGEIRPIRLLSKFKERLREGTMDKQLEGKCDPLEIVSAHYEGEQWVSGLETSTHTYFCEGFGAHNSVAEHSVVLSDWCRRRYGAEIGLWALLHDASEAYLVDVPRPIKPHLKGYSWIEAGVMDAICERFEMDPGMPPEVHEADGRIIADERENMAPCTVEWAPTGEPLGVAFSYWSPAWAEAHFMMAFNALMHEREAEERRVA